MRPEYEQYEQIERYLHGELSAPELAAFESRLLSDALFNEEVKHHRAIHDLVIDQGLLDLKAKMKAYDAGYADSPGAWRVVSTVVLVMSLSAVGFISSGTKRLEPVLQPAMAVTAPQGEKTEPVVSPQTAAVNLPLPAVTAPAIEPGPAFMADTTLAETDTTFITPQPRIALRDSILKLPAPPRLIVPLTPLKVTMPKPVPCALMTTALKVAVSESCTTLPSGTITIDESGMEGKRPLAFSIDGKNYRPGHTFSNLYPGTYFLFVKDASGCVAHEAQEVTVDEKDCRAHEYSFYPDKGETWKLPVAASSSGKIDIYNRNGVLVYTSAIDHGHPSQWDGQALPMGSYSFVLVTEGKTTTGYVTILK